MTNGDRIRKMTDEELTEVLRCKCCDFNNKPECATFDCKKGIKKWLEKEIEDNNVLDQ